ncbi:MAG: 23S rRNA (pseudouridine(1915)-N(3))-methyltransferase RlmH [Pseudomonadota bacterium]
MRINMIAMGNKMPSWVSAAYQDYAKRLTDACALKLIEIALKKRGKQQDLKQLRQQEGAAMLTAIPKNTHIIALDTKGHCWDTITLSQQLKTWFSLGQNISLLIGGPEGLAPQCLEKAQQCWSLSPLTFPHPLVRVIVAEQLYRAYSLLRGHPYHK